MLSDETVQASLLRLGGGGTLFVPALKVQKLFNNETQEMYVVVVFITDSEQTMQGLPNNRTKIFAQIASRGNLSFFGVAFGDAANNAQFRELFSCLEGQVVHLLSLRSSTVRGFFNWRSFSC